MNAEMIKVVEWLQINKPSLNLKKTHFIIFGSKRGRILSNKDLIINNVIISQVDRTKFLRVIIPMPYSIHQGENRKRHRYFIQMQTVFQPKYTFDII